jgi:hypothetical protein
MKPAFIQLLKHYPAQASRGELYGEIGWDDLIDNQSYMNTCAVRMSYGLLRAEVPLPGARMKAKAGVLAGKLIEPGQEKLSEILKMIWGWPEVYTDEHEARAGIGSRNGVVSFFRIGGGAVGHIDLIVHRPGSRFQDCARTCFWAAKPIWFWPLN